MSADYRSLLTVLMGAGVAPRALVIAGGEAVQGVCKGAYLGWCPSVEPLSKLVVAEGTGAITEGGAGGGRGECGAARVLPGCPADGSGVDGALDESARGGVGDLEPFGHISNGCGWLVVDGVQHEQRGQLDVLAAVRHVPWCLQEASHADQGLIEGPQVSLVDIHYVCIIHI